MIVYSYASRYVENKFINNFPHQSQKKKEKKKFK